MFANSRALLYIKDLTTKDAKVRKENQMIVKKFLLIAPLTPGYFFTPSRKQQ